jgi:DNA-directed RNA polymerase subunit RPC12/RpoP
MAKCAECGATLRNEGFCQECGAKVIVDKKKPKIEGQVRVTSGFWLNIGIAIILGVAIYFLVTQYLIK